MAGWLPLAISTDCGCNSRSLQDGWELIGWLAPTSSTDCGCNCRSPRDGWAIVGWLALTIFTDQKAISTTTTTNNTGQLNTRTKWLGGWRCLVQEHFSCQSRPPGDGWEMAGRWLGGCPWLFPKIAGVILDRYKMAGRWLGGWHKPVPQNLVAIVNRQEMAGWLGLAISNEFGCND